MTSENNLVLRTLDRGVCTLTLNNPERRNAWSVPMEERYFALLDEADADADVRAIVLTGAGTTFCPGLDAQRLSAVAGEGRVVLTTRRPQTKQVLYYYFTHKNDSGISPDNSQLTPDAGTTTVNHQ